VLLDQFFELVDARPAICAGIALGLDGPDATMTLVTQTPDFLIRNSMT
jgi:hypothetical protein